MKTNLLLSVAALCLAVGCGGMSVEEEGVSSVTLGQLEAAQRAQSDQEAGDECVDLLFACIFRIPATVTDNEYERRYQKCLRRYEQCNSIELDLVHGEIATSGDLDGRDVEIAP